MPSVESHNNNNNTNKKKGKRGRDPIPPFHKTKRPICQKETELLRSNKKKRNVRVVFILRDKKPRREKRK